MTMRGIRGATCLTSDDADEMRTAVSELLGQILERNGLSTESLISVVLTGTPDLTSAFPAAGAREFGLADFPLLCAQEMDIAGALPLTVRVLVHAEMDVPRSAVQHVYLRGAEVLRQDLAQ